VKIREKWFYFCLSVEILPEIRQQLSDQLILGDSLKRVAAGVQSACRLHIQTAPLPEQLKTWVAKYEGAKLSSEKSSDRSDMRPSHENKRCTYNGKTAASAVRKMRKKSECLAESKSGLELLKLSVYTSSWRSKSSIF